MKRERTINTHAWELRRSKRARIAELQKGVCPLCHGEKYLTIHHIKAKSRGGSDAETNLIGLCRPCHDRIEKEGSRQWEPMFKRWRSALGGRFNL